MNTSINDKFSSTINHTFQYNHYSYSAIIKRNDIQKIYSIMFNVKTEETKKQIYLLNCKLKGK